MMHFYVTSCRWRGLKCGPDNFQLVFTDHGICYTLDNRNLSVNSAGVCLTLNNSLKVNTKKASIYDTLGGRNLIVNYTGRYVSYRPPVKQKLISS